MIKVGIIGATGVVGRKVLQVLEEKKLPIDEYELFASKKSAGKIMKFFGKDYEVHELSREEIKNAKLTFAIFSAGTDVAKEFAPIVAETGAIVIDNSNAFRMDPNVPLVVPEVNPEEICKNHGIIANPNCSTIQAVVALKPLDDKYKIKRIVYTTFQAVSGAGRDGIEDLENGIKEYNEKNCKDCEKNKNIGKSDKNNKNVNNLEKCKIGLKKFEYPIFNNCLPHIDIFMDNGYTREETKMINETRKILKKENLKITATCVRVPVFNSHSESINIEFENSFEIDDVKETLKKANGVIVVDNIKNSNPFESKENSEIDKSNLMYPIATVATESDDVYVGRIRRDYSVNNGLNIWVVADNIRKGAASNAVQILELLLTI